MPFKTDEINWLLRLLAGEDIRMGSTELWIQNEGISEKKVHLLAPITRPRRRAKSKLRAGQTNKQQNQRTKNEERYPNV